MGLGLRPVPASMPRAHQWPTCDHLSANEPGPDQPPLPWATGPQMAQPGPARTRQPRSSANLGQIRVVTSGAAWSCVPAAGLPDPTRSCVRLCFGIVETLQGLRPLRQLSRWLDDPVLAIVGLHARRPAGRQPPIGLKSIHLQVPSPVSVEAVAVYRVNERTEVMALRLEARGQHWLCTAWETGRATAERARSAPTVTHRA